MLRHISPGPAARTRSDSPSFNFFRRLCIDSEMFEMVASATAKRAEVHYSANKSFCNFYKKIDADFIERCLFTALEMMKKNRHPYCSNSQSPGDGIEAENAHYWSPKVSRSKAAVKERDWRVFMTCVTCDFEALLDNYQRVLQGLVRSSGVCGVDELIVEWKGSKLIHGEGRLQRVEPVPTSVCPGKSHENGLKLYVIETRGSDYPEPLAYVLEWSRNSHLPAAVLNYAALNAVEPLLLPNARLLLFADSWYFKMPFIEHAAEKAEKDIHFSLGRYLILTIRHPQRGASRRHP